MITQVEIDGFKTFKDFKVELAPFQVIVGANGSGKSNLFDALQLLGRLAELDLRSALQGLRGEPGELFAKISDRDSANKIHISVDMLLNPMIEDSLRRKANVSERRLRYTVDIRQEKESDGLEVAFETLESIPLAEDSWLQKHIPEKYSFSASKEKKIFISTSDSMEGAIVDLHQDGRGQKVSSPASSLDGTVLRGVVNTEYPHVFAVREELRSLRFFHFNPLVLRQPSPTKAPQNLATDGAHLASVLARIQKEDKLALGDISRDMANLVPGILKIHLERDRLGERFVIYAETSDKRVFSSQVLSDGTLRLLALATLKNDLQFHGILCLEEPENGVSPPHLRNMAHLLRKMATDLRDVSQLKEPLRQVLITTHSPLFISQPDVIDALLLAFMPTLVQSSTDPVHVTRMVPVMTHEALAHLENISRDDKAIGAYATNTLADYLDGKLLAEARERLEKSHSELNER
jgi:predicted ATPase